MRAEANKHGAFLIEAPAVISLAAITKSYRKTLLFLEQIRQTTLDRSRPVIIDFRACTKFSIEVAPVVLAEVHRARYVKGGAFIKGISSRVIKVREILKASGLEELLSLQVRHAPVPTPGEGALCTMRTGIAIDGEVSLAIAGDFAEALGLDELHRSRVHSALNEALENITEHAYASEFEAEVEYPRERGRWWICSVSDPKQRLVALLACDLGASIPRTLPSTAVQRGQENFRALTNILGRDGARPSAERLLEAAFNEDVTRRANRAGGKGLTKMAAIVRDFEAGNLAVFSGEAIALVTKDKPMARARALPMPFTGTLIMWHLEREKGSDV